MGFLVLALAMFFWIFGGIVGSMDLIIIGWILWAVYIIKYTIRRISMDDKQWRLCYVKDNFMWFTQTPIDKVWGDDWNDVPYEHNAGEPYKEFGPYTKIVFDEIELEMPGSYSYNSSYSIQAINNNKVAWLSTGEWCDNQVVILAGYRMDECIAMITKAGGKIYVEMED